jgi:hypothetical protein
VDLAQAGIATFSRLTRAYNLEQGDFIIPGERRPGRRAAATSAFHVAQLKPIMALPNPPTTAERVATPSPGAIGLGRLPIG